MYTVQETFTRRSTMADAAVRSFITAVHAQSRAAMIPAISAAAIKAMIAECYAPGATFIRPSGNPMSMIDYESMMTSGMVTMTESELVSIDNVNVFAGGKSAWVVTKEHQSFTYTPQGGEPIPNNDLATISYILENNDGTAWKIVGGHRGTGQPFEG